MVDDFEEGELAEEGEQVVASESEPAVPASAAVPPEPRPPCQHDVALPPTAPPLSTSDPMRCLPVPDRFDALEFPFELDPFQQKALAAIDRGESVLVSAHTSAGKTVVAQYAIALSLKRGQRVVYTCALAAHYNRTTPRNPSSRPSERDAAVRRSRRCPTRSTESFNFNSLTSA